MVESPPRKMTKTLRCRPFDKVGSIERLKYAAYRKMLKTSAERTNIKEDFTKVLQTREGHELANDLTEMQMREYFGWSKDSQFLLFMFISRAETWTMRCSR